MSNVQSTPQVEKGIPVPIGSGRQGVTKYPFRDMEVGDSFFVAKETGKEEHRVRAAARACQQEIGLRFTCRNVIENEVAGIRIWRFQ